MCSGNLRKKSFYSNCTKKKEKKAAVNPQRFISAGLAGGTPKLNETKIYLQKKQRIPPPKKKKTFIHGEQS